MIWTISNSQIYPRFLVYNTFVMSKGVKACFSMIASHTTLTKAAKRHLACCQMNQRVIYTAAAKSDFFYYTFGCALMALYQLCVEDNGHGCADNMNKTTGIGLKNMQERVSTLNGTLRIESEKGFRIFVVIPKEMQ